MPILILWRPKQAGKALPVTGRGTSYGCETSRLPHFLDTLLTDGGEVSFLSTVRPLLLWRFLVLSSERGWVDFRAMASSEFEPVAFRFV
jgi:hypothetical protein